MNETLITAVLNWPRQKADFVCDGSLRDIYVQDATLDDWKCVVDRILSGNYRARLQRRGTEVSLPTDFKEIFDGNDRHFMSFTVGEVVLECHFFTPTEIEVSFAPNDVTEMSMRDLLAFMIDIGEATGKTVIMAPENGAQSPIFVYDPKEHALRWISPGE